MLGYSILALLLLIGTYLGSIQSGTDPSHLASMTVFP